MKPEGDILLVTFEAGNSDPRFPPQPAARQQERLTSIAGDPAIIDLSVTRPAREDTPALDVRREARASPDGFTGQVLVIGAGCVEGRIDHGVTIHGTRMYSHAPDQATPGPRPAVFSGHALGSAPPGAGARLNLRVRPRQETAPGVDSVPVDIENLDASSLVVSRGALPPAGVARWRLLHCPGPLRGPRHARPAGERVALAVTFVAEGRPAGLGYRDPDGGQHVRECWGDCGGAGPAPIVRTSD